MDARPNGQGRIADGLEQRHLFGRQPRRLPHAAMHHVLHHHAGHAEGQRGLVAGCAHNSRSS